jgi:glycerol-3-phosphate acyltransferase PlsY
MQVALAILCAYLLGNIPFGYLIARAKGINLFEHGSGNIGATNVFRVVGKGYGISCFLLDFAKGFLAAGVLPTLLLTQEQLADHCYIDLVCGAAAIAGHNWPAVLKFKGGKGIASSGGVLAAVAPLAVVAAISVWIVTMLLSRYVSLSSILAATTVVVAGWVFYGHDPVLAGVLTLLGLLAVLRHRSNIQRLLKGEELRFGQKKPKEEDAA